MNPLIAPSTLSAQAVTAAAGSHAAYRFLEFFTVQIRNPHARRAYALPWPSSALDRTGTACRRSRPSTRSTSPPSFEVKRTHSAPTVKQRLAAIRMLFDGLANGGVLPFNPATAVRGPRHVVRRGKTPALAPDEERALLDAIDTTTSIDWALIGLMVYTFARIGEATAMRVGDVYVQTILPVIREHGKRLLAGALRDKILDLETVLPRRPVSALCLDLRSRPISS